MAHSIQIAYPALSKTANHPPQIMQLVYDSDDFMVVHMALPAFAGVRIANVPIITDASEATQQEEVLEALGVSSSSHSHTQRDRQGKRDSQPFERLSEGAPQKEHPPKDIPNPTGAHQHSVQAIAIYSKKEESATDFSLELTLDRVVNSHDLLRSGFEIVDKRSGREVYLDGRWADFFQQQILLWQETEPTSDEVETILERYSALASTPITMH